MISMSATFSEDGIYRYRLERIWSREKPVLYWVMLNPSTADATKDDPTVHRCIGFSLNWGYGGIEVQNIFALRSTDPRGLLSHADPIGPDCDKHLAAIPHDAEVVCAWGSFPERLGVRDRDVLRILRGRLLWCLDITMSGYPRHPLYVPYSQPLEAFGDMAELAEESGLKAKA